MPELWPHLQNKLDRRHAAGLWRQRQPRGGPQRPRQTVNGRELLSFCSNDYLGLAAHPEVVRALVRGAGHYGVGSGASHMVNGHCHAHEALERELAAFTGRDRALLFSTGYMANTGIIHALMGRDGLVLQDSLNHASLLDGGWLCKAPSRRYPHWNMEALARQLGESRAGHKLVVSDGVFSMDGDLAPLPEMLHVTQQHRAWLMIDDAHGIGCLGEAGGGSLELARQQDPGLTIDQETVPLLVGTLGKALGTAGAFVAGEASLIGYLEQFARSHVFTTAMPPALAEATRSSLRLAREQPWRRCRLGQLVTRFREAAREMDLPLIASRSPIQAVLLGDADLAVRASEWLAERGLHVPAIRPPTVPEGASRLRITFSAAHSDEDMDHLLEALAGVAAMPGIGEPEGIRAEAGHG